MKTPETKKPFTVAAMRHSGTHLITPIVRFLTGKTVYSPKGDSSLICIPSPVVIVFVRDPRNWLIAAYRYKHPRTPWPSQEFDEAAHREGRALDKKLAAFIPPYVEFARKWAARWMGWPGSLGVRFEHLTGDADRAIAEIRRIQTFLGEPAAAASAEDVYARVYKQSGTFSGRHSRYQEWFGPETMAVWKRHGGDRIAEMMGYPK